MATSNKAFKQYQRSMRARLRLWAWMQLHELGGWLSKIRERWVSRTRVQLPPICATCECIVYLWFFWWKSCHTAFAKIQRESLFRSLFRLLSCHHRWFLSFPKLLLNHSSPSQLSWFRQCCCERKADSSSSIRNLCGVAQNNSGSLTISFSHAESSVFAKSSQHFQHYLVRRFDIFSMVKSF